MSAQDYWKGLEQLRADYTARLARLDQDREGALMALPAAKPIVDAFRLAIRNAQLTRDTSFSEIDDARERALAVASGKRPDALARAERTLRDARMKADNDREDARRKAKAEYDEALRKIEATRPLHAQTEPKSDAAEAHQRKLAEADEAHGRAWARSWDAYQNANRDVLDDERIAHEKAETEARRSREAATGHFEDTVRNAEAIMRSKLSAVAADVQARFDREHERIVEEWESKKDDLSRRYREGRAGPGSP